MSYNIIKKSLDTKLNGYQVSSLGAGNYLTLISSPPLANVQLQLNDNTAPKIPFNEGDTLEANGVDRVYITADIVSGEQLIFGQSNSNDFKITPAPKVKDIEKIGEITAFNSVLLTALDKISNPYDLSNISILSGSSTAVTYTTILDVVLDCDKIIFDLVGGAIDGNNNSAMNGKIDLFIDNVLVDTAGGRNDSYLSAVKNQSLFYLENVRGKNLKIKYNGKSASYVGYYYIQKINLKV